MSVTVVYIELYMQHELYIGIDYLTNMTANYKCNLHNQHIKWVYRPNILHKYATTQPTAINTSHIIAKCKLQTHMPT